MNVPLVRPLEMAESFRRRERATMELTEVVNNQFVSIYETPNELPDFLLTSLVIAGHQVEVTPIDSPYPDGPVHRLIVRKSVLSQPSMD